MKWSRVPALGTTQRSDGAARPPLRSAPREIAENRDARLELRLDGATLWADLSVGGEAQSARRVVDLAAAEALAAEMSAVLNRGTRWGDADQGSRELLRQRGELLFDSLLPAEIKARMRSLGAATRTGRDAIRLLLVVDAALLGLPWELLHSGADFIGLAFAVGRVVRGLQPETMVAAESERGWRTLIVCDPRGDLIGSYYEGLSLRDELAQGEARVEVDLRSSEVSLMDVKRLIREYDVVHFAGHAERGDGPERGWWLRDGVLGPSAVRELTGGRRFPRLIFSNACRSAGDGSMTRGIGATGLAAAFLEAGVEHYIGTVQDVPDEPASLFALTFYAALRARPDAGIGEAMRAGRVMLAERYGASSVYWASWVLYGAPSRQCMARASEAATVPITRVAAKTAGQTFHAAGARMRGAEAVAPNVGLSLPGWSGTRITRGVGVVLGTIGIVWLLVMLAGLIGRSPPVAWTSGKALARFGDDARATSTESGERPAWVGDVAPKLELVRDRLRFAVPQSGFVAVWRVPREGAIRRIDVERGALSAVQAGWIVELPLPAKDGGGPDRFYLAWRQVPPSDPIAFAIELDREVSDVGSALEAVQVNGMGLVVAPDDAARTGPRASPEEIRARFEEVLEDRFDKVTPLAAQDR